MSKRLPAFPFLQIKLAESQIVLDSAAQETTFCIQVSQVPVHFVSGWIDFQDFFVGRNSLEGGAFRPECRGGLQVGRNGVGSGIPLEVEIPDRVKNASVGRRL